MNCRKCKSPVELDNLKGYLICIGCKLINETHYINYEDEQNMYAEAEQVSTKIQRGTINFNDRLSNGGIDVGFLGVQDIQLSKPEKNQDELYIIGLKFMTKINSKLFKINKRILEQAKEIYMQFIKKYDRQKRTYKKDVILSIDMAYRSENQQCIVVKGEEKEVLQILCELLDLNYSKTVQQRKLFDVQFSYLLKNVYKQLIQKLGQQLSLNNEEINMIINVYNKIEQNQLHEGQRVTTKIAASIIFLIYNNKIKVNFNIQQICGFLQISDSTARKFYDKIKLYQNLLQ